MEAPSIQKFDLEDTEKLVGIVAASEMTREYCYAPICNSCPNL